MSGLDEEFRRRLQAAFEAEAEAHVQAVIADMLEVEGARPGAAQALVDMLKRLHSLKGAARAVGHAEAELLCHALEGMCQAWRERRLAPVAAHFDLVQQACRTLAAVASTQDARMRNRALRMGRALDAAVGGAPRAADVSDDAPAQDDGDVAVPVPAPTVTDGFVRVPVRQLELLRVRADALLGVEQLLDGELKRLAALLGRMAYDAGESAAVRSELRALLLAMSEAGGRMGAIRAAIAETVLDATQSPVADALAHLPGLVREIARAEGKEAALEMDAELIGIDRRVLDAVRVALGHLVSNALVHGIETPERRRAAGKPVRGTLQVAIRSEESGRMLLSVRDDGAGLDTDALAAAAVRAGVLTQEQADLLEPGQRAALALQPGVSTSASVDRVAGRGLGLAAVADQAKALGGALSVRGTPGHGCLVELRLPLRQAAMRALFVEAAGMAYALPLSAVGAVLAIDPVQVVNVQARPVLRYGDALLPLLDLAVLLGEPADDAASAAVVVDAAAGRFALRVGAIRGEREILLKSLGRHLRRVRYVLGATQTGGDRLVPVLAPDDLYLAVHARPAVAAAGRDDAARPLRVLVAEDSVTSRLLLKHILEGAGYDIETAADGREAASMLRRTRFHALVSDIEMPAMDGLALTRAVRMDAALRELPVVLVTTLADAGERERGLEAGADAYLVKGDFDQDTLLATLRRLIAGGPP